MIGDDTVFVSGMVWTGLGLADDNTFLAICGVVIAALALILRDKRG
jgi:hypothetical protein